MRTGNGEMLDKARCYLGHDLSGIRSSGAHPNSSRGRLLAIEQELDPGLVEVNSTSLKQNWTTFS